MKDSSACYVLPALGPPTRTCSVSKCPVVVSKAGVILHTGNKPGLLVGFQNPYLVCRWLCPLPGSVCKFTFCHATNISLLCPLGISEGEQLETPHIPDTRVCVQDGGGGYEDLFCVSGLFLSRC